MCISKVFSIVFMLIHTYVLCFENSLLTETEDLHKLQALHMLSLP